MRSVVQFSATDLEFRQFSCALDKQKFLQGTGQLHAGYATQPYEELIGHHPSKKINRLELLLLFRGCLEKEVGNYISSIYVHLSSNSWCAHTAQHRDRH